MTTMLRLAGLAAAALVGLTACATTESPGAGTAAPALTERRDAAAFEADRAAILAMAGEYAVTFDFTEVLAIAPGYELAEPKITPAREVVYVIEDTGDFIALQHLLLAGEEDEPVVIKHWRQDWQYEPAEMLAFRGFGTWDVIGIDPAEAAGAWSQTVYQVDDSPRYAGLARWEHTPEAATWEPAVSWRPLPRRDATTRDDYDTIAAVNRHTVTASGWSHEQDNSKLVLRGGTPRELVREHGINTYVRTGLAGGEAVAAYWDNTQDYWARVREAWDGFIAEGETIVVEDDAEGTQLYGPMLSEAQAVHFGLESTDQAWADAAALLQAQVTVDGQPAKIE